MIGTMTEGLSFAQIQVLENIGRCREVDVRAISETYRQRAIDLAMMEPPLVDIDADRLRLTGEGHARWTALRGRLSVA